MSSETIVRFAVTAYTFLLPIAWLLVAISVVVLGPMALFRRTRPAAGTGLFLASYIFGLTTWFLAAAVTFATYGWIGFLLGLFLAGVGVVPIAIFAAFVSLGAAELGISLIVMTIIVFAARGAGLTLAQNAS